MHSMSGDAPPQIPIHPLVLSETTASSADVQPLVSSTTMSTTRPMEKSMARNNSPLKEIIMSVFSESEGRVQSTSTTGKNECPLCSERFDHSLRFHNRVKHVNKITIGSGPHRTEAKRGENGKFACPFCSTYTNVNPEKLRIHLPSCNKRYDAVQQQSNKRHEQDQNQGKSQNRNAISNGSPSHTPVNGNELGVPAREEFDGESDDIHDELPSKNPDSDGPPTENHGNDNGDAQAKQLLPESAHAHIQSNTMHSSTERQTRRRNHVALKRDSPNDNRAQADGIPQATEEPRQSWRSAKQNCRHGTPETESDGDDDYNPGRPTRNHGNNNDNGVMASGILHDERDPSVTIKHLLSKLNLGIISLPPRHQRDLPHRFIVCVECQKGLNPEDAVSHATNKKTNKGHQIPVSLTEKKLLWEWIGVASDLHSSQNLPPIPNGHTPPISGLQVLSGFRCPSCGLCKESDDMMKRHTSSTGHTQCKKTNIQYFFPAVEKIYFAVQPGRRVKKKGTENVADADLYALYAEKFGVDIEENTLPRYRDEKEMPLLLQSTRWFDHLWPYLRLGNDCDDGDLSKQGDSGNEDSSAEDEVRVASSNEAETKVQRKRKRSQSACQHLTQSPLPKRIRSQHIVTILNEEMGDDGEKARAYHIGLDSESDSLLSHDDMDEDRDESSEDNKEEDESSEDNEEEEESSEDNEEEEGHDFETRRVIGTKDQRRWSKWDSLTSVSKAKSLVSVCQLNPKEQDCWYGRELKNTIVRYAKRIRKMVETHPASFQIRRLLGGNKPYWTPLSNPTTITTYALLLQRFLRGIAVTMNNGGQQRHTSGYQFPLTMNDKVNFLNLKTQLSKKSPKNSSLEALHKFLKPLLYPPRETTNSKWDQPVECFLALISLRSDGTFNNPNTITQPFAILRYFIRCAIFYEASMSRDSLLSALAREGEKNFASCVTSPFKSCVEYHALAKFLARNSTSAPTTRSGDDGMVIQYKEITLEVPLWRKGLERLLKKANEMIDRVCYGKDFGFKNPERTRDDWSNNDRGYTAFKPAAFLEHPLPLLDAMLHDKALGLAASPDGKSLVINMSKVQERMAAFTEINKTLALLVFFMSGQPGRGTEFSDCKISNSHRPRSLFLDERANVWYVVRRVKWENITQREVFLPKKCPPKVSDLLKKYLLIIRPVEMHFSLQIHGKGTDSADLAIHNYSTFLWVRQGERMKSRVWGEEIAVFLREECSCVDGNLSSYRHFSVEMSRIFLEDISYTGPAQQRGHSAKTAQRTYAVEADHLPMMSSDVLLCYGKWSEEWWNLTGVGPNKELPAPFWVREERERHGLLELKNEMGELKKLLTRVERAVGQIGRKTNLEESTSL